MDWLILVLLVIGFVGGFFKGVVKQVFSLGGLILGIICGSLLYRPFAGFLLDIFKMSDQVARIVAFIVILLVVPMVCGLVGVMLSKLVHAASLGFVDRLLGAVFGTLKTLVLIGLVIQLLNVWGLTEAVIDERQQEQSKLFVPVSEMADKCLDWTMDRIKENTEDLIPDFEEQQNKSNKSDTKKV